MAEWYEFGHPWERLRWARMRWQAERGVPGATARDAAESLGMGENTYTAYERPPGEPGSPKKHTPLTHQRAIQFGRKFGVNWVWLLSGEETPFARTPAQQRAIDLLAEADEETQELAVDLIEAALRRRAG